MMEKILNKLGSFPSVPPIPHEHSWDLVAKTFARPRRDLSNLSALPSELVEKALFGVTTLLWECKACQQLRREELLGSDEATLDEVMDKASELGPQLLERGSETFAVSKFINPAAAPGVIPVR